MNELLAFLVLSLLKFNGQYYRAKEVLPLTEEQAQPYLEQGAIRLVNDDDVDVSDTVDVSGIDAADIKQVDLPEGYNPVDDTVTTANQISLLEAIAKLDPENGEHYTATGKPKTDALSELVGREVSAAERDDAFATFTTDEGPE